MENDYKVINQGPKIDSMELLTRFILNCKNKSRQSNDSIMLTFADIVTAVYYFRRHRNEEEFIQKFLGSCQDYFLLQWVRSTWQSLSKMTDEEISELVINQVSLVAQTDE